MGKNVNVAHMLKNLNWDAIEKCGAIVLAAWGLLMSFWLVLAPEVNIPEDLAMLGLFLFLCLYTAHSLYDKHHFFTDFRLGNRQITSINYEEAAMRPMLKYLVGLALIALIIGSINAYTSVSIEDEGMLKYYIVSTVVISFVFLCTLRPKTKAPF